MEESQNKGKIERHDCYSNLTSSLDDASLVLCTDFRYLLLKINYNLKNIVGKIYDQSKCKKSQE